MACGCTVQFEYLKHETLWTIHCFPFIRDAAPWRLSRMTVRMLSYYIYNQLDSFGNDSERGLDIAIGTICTVQTRLWKYRGKILIDRSSALKGGSICMQKKMGWLGSTWAATSLSPKNIGQILLYHSWYLSPQNFVWLKWSCSYSGLSITYRVVRSGAVDDDHVWQ